MASDVEISAAALQQALDQFLPTDEPTANVVGFGSGIKWTKGQPTGNAAVLVFVAQKLPAESLAERDVIPSHMDDGTPTDVVSIGYPVAQPTPPSAVASGALSLTRRMRPCPSGFSIGNVAITAGTLGGVVYDLLPGSSVNPPASGIGTPATFYVLSNNHVLAATNAAPLGSAIVQPGPFDGGQDPQDRIATLSRFVPIQLSPQVPLALHQNLVDCAIGQCDFQDATREIYFSGGPRAWRRKSSAAVGDLVKKTGRTTNISFGRIISVNATVDVRYGANVARFRDQIITSNISAGGDSGSLVTTLDNVAVGLLFAGSAQVTIVNHLEDVRALLRVEIAEVQL
jgi:hypothetical protein